MLFQIGSKTVKQCVQFYYLWKKICPEDYKRLRLGRRRTRESEFEFEFSKSDIPVSNYLHWVSLLVGTVENPYTMLFK